MQFNSYASYTADVKSGCDDRFRCSSMTVRVIGVTSFQDAGGYSFKSDAGHHFRALCPRFRRRSHHCLDMPHVRSVAAGYLEYGRRAVRAVHIEKPFRRPWFELLHAWAEDTRTASEMHVVRGHGCVSSQCELVCPKLRFRVFRSI